MEPWLSRTPHNFLFFWVEPLVGASAGATPPLYEIVRGLLGWNSTVYGGYEVVIYLFRSPHPLCFVALFLPFLQVIAPIWRIPDVMVTTGCDKSLPDDYLHFLHTTFYF